MKSEEKIDSKLILAGETPCDQITQYVAASDICLLPAKNEVMTILCQLRCKDTSL